MTSKNSESVELLNVYRQTGSEIVYLWNLEEKWKQTRHMD